MLNEIPKILRRIGECSYVERNSENPASYYDLISFLQQ